MDLSARGDDALIKPATVESPAAAPEAAAQSSPLRRLGAPFLARLAARPRLSRAAVLALSVTLAAALGSAIGALAAVMLVRPQPQPAPSVIAQGEREAIAKLSADIAALKSSIDGVGKQSATQIARLGERLADRIERSEKAQLEPAAKLARLTDAVEKLERKTAQAAQPAPAAAPEITGSIAMKQTDKPPVVAGWVLHEVYEGVATVESRHGLYEAVPGTNLPGLGRVQNVRRQDGRWVVVTPKGLIVSAR